LSGTPLGNLPVRELANFSLVSVRPSDQLGDALAVMIRERVHRVVVADVDSEGIVDGERIVGILEALDLFSFMSNHSYLISIQISKSDDIAGLVQAAEHINRLVALLHQGGTKVSLIATLVQELSARLFERTWQLIAPPDLVANSCLFVMGSEGRGEQLLKTDQDNGLILRDGHTPPANLAEICSQFSAALRDFGYPDCPGNIMVSNPVWRQTASDFGRMTRQWLLMPTPDSLMSLAIFLDARAVCGDASLLEGVRRGVFNLVTDNDAMLARFASALNSFPESGGWWNRLLLLGDSNEESLDLKKAGIFPLVHGIRSMALEQRLSDLGTTARIERLVAAGKVTAAMGADLTESLHFFMGLKLKVGLAELVMNLPVSGGIQVSKLSSLDRDLLKDTLAVVKRFKLLLRQHFHLDMLA
jgi:CBS domain-containing protein